MAVPEGSRPARPRVRGQTVQRRPVGGAVYRRAGAWPTSAPAWPSAAALLSLAAPAAAPAAAAPRRRTAAPTSRSSAAGRSTVPLDRSGRLAGTRRPALRRPGGPLRAGRCSWPWRAAPGSRRSAWPKGSRRRSTRCCAATASPSIDQRGTGESGALRCPSVQRLRSLDPFRPAAVGACARAVGPRRAAYTTADTVQDLDALRAAFGSAKLALMGVSYGTHVALQYARTFPARTDRLVLDSIVGPDGPDPFLLDTLRNLPRVLRTQCAGGVCAGVDRRDPVADLAAVVRRLARRPVAGDRRRRAGPAADRALPHRRGAAVPHDRRRPQPLPAGAAARRRSPPPGPATTALLLRLRAVGQGGLTPLGDLSFGLNVTTGCTDGATPYPLSVAPGAARAAAARAALAAVPPSRYAPFDAATVQAASYGDDCLLWPQDPEPAPATGPLPDVPALLLGGGLDLRTPRRERQGHGGGAPARDRRRGRRDGSRRPRHRRHGLRDGCARALRRRPAGGPALPGADERRRGDRRPAPPRCASSAPPRGGRSARARGVRRPGHAGGRARDRARPALRRRPRVGRRPARRVVPPPAAPGPRCGCAPTPTCAACG